MKAPDGSMRPFENVPNQQTLEQHGARVVHSTEPQLILDDLFFITRRDPRITPFEVGMPGQHRRTEDGSGWEPDPLLMDERFVALRVKGKGVFVLTACSHAGIANVLAHAQTTFPGDPLHGVIGGFHLAGATERLIPETVAAMRGYDLKVVAPRTAPAGVPQEPWCPRSVNPWCVRSRKEYRFDHATRLAGRECLTGYVS